MYIILILSLFSQSMDIDELSAQLHLETGNAYLSQRLLGQAEEEFLLVLELSEDCYPALLGLGKVHLERSSWNRSEEYYRQYIEACPEDYRGYYELSNLLLMINSPERALIMADSAFLRAPTNPEIWLLSGRAGLGAGDTASAEMWFIKNLQTPGLIGVESLVLLASVYRNTSRRAEARELLLPLAASGYAPAYWGLAQVYLAWNDYMRAGDAINNYLILSPDGPYADSAFMVLEVLGESGDYMY
ncbi:MAG: tetratricopeptide repeat protein [Candidatus Aegiribacteria sp.]|nr:tetratricopeptide repeat protein [Candidatus Aegiribacteria sp.]